MIWAFLSTRLRTWLLFAVLLPIGGRVLEAVGVRVGRTPTQVAEIAMEILGA